MKKRLSVFVMLATLTACESAESIISNFADIEPTGLRELSDENAFRRMIPNRQESPDTDLSSVMRVIDAEAADDADSMAMESPEVEKLLRRLVHPRNQIDESRYVLVDFDKVGRETPDSVQKSNCAYEVIEDDLYDEYLIPHLEKVPVRDQGLRGTCAAFTAVGAIEYALLNPTDGEGGLPNMETIDLSEQRFYWMSKEECQGPSGCECPGCSEGSWYGSGFDASSNDSALNIPLESACPYAASVGMNDTQYPQKRTCEEGVVRVEQVESWCGLDDLVNLLHRGYAVPYGSPLSSNWEANDGMITKADLDAEGSTVHASGHAYLIVGYKRLPNQPEEGGICFMVKNSWGAGWGVNGYACMTLAWMRAVSFDDFISFDQPVPVSVLVRDDLQEAALVPETNEMVEDDIATDLIEEALPGDENADLLPAEEVDLNPEDTDDANMETDTEPMGGTPGPDEVDDDDDSGYSPANLIGPNETFYRVETKAEGNELLVRGLLRNDAGFSRPVRVVKQGERLIYKGDEVGRLSNEGLSLCSGEFAALCSIRYRESDQQIYLQFRDDDLRVVQASEHSPDKGSWLSIDALDREFGIFIPNSFTSLSFLANPKTFIRLGDKQPARLSLRRAAGSIDYSILFSGEAVGQLTPTSPTNSALCTGDFDDRCQFFGNTRTFLLPRNGGSRKARESN